MSERSVAQKRPWRRRLARGLHWKLGCLLGGAVLAHVLATTFTGAAPAQTNPLGVAGFVIDQQQFTGQVEQELPAGSYTYFSLRLPDQQRRWVVVLGKQHRRMSWLQVKSYGSRRDFQSRRLDRSFDRLYFVSVLKSGR